MNNKTDNFNNIQQKKIGFVQILFNKILIICHFIIFELTVASLYTINNCNHIKSKHPNIAHFNLPKIAHLNFPKLKDCNVPKIADFNLLQ